MQVTRCDAFANKSNQILKVKMSKNLITIGLKSLALIVMVSSIATAQSQKTADKNMTQQSTMQKKEMSAEPQMSRAYLHNYNVPSSGVAIDGYCPVAYFAANKAIKGKPEFASTHNDITYYFVSAAAKAMFDKNPQQYLPAYGGWCATGMALGDKFPVDPTNFKISDGKLLLFLKNKNVDALSIWDQNSEQEQIGKADAHWAKVTQ
jgi:YHS domain-containing protein